MSALRLGRLTLRKGRTLGKIFHSYAGQRRARPKRPASFYQILMECNPKAKTELLANFRVTNFKRLARSEDFKNKVKLGDLGSIRFEERLLPIRYRQPSCGSTNVVLTEPISVPYARL